MEMWDRISALFFLVLMSNVLISSATFDAHEEWLAFKKTHGKEYKLVKEEQIRLNIFLSNLDRIKQHNSLYDQGKKSFKLKMNKFGDLTLNEFHSKMNTYKMGKRSISSNIFKLEPNETLPEEVDWRQKGAVTGVKDQGNCGSCWAFSATGSLEGQWFLRNGSLVPLSEQNLVDCSRGQENEGCDGGWMDSAFEYVKENGGIDTEEAYPYRGEDEDCRFDPASTGATLSGYTDIPEGDEAALRQAVATVGPVSAAIDASGFVFQFYDSGVYYDEDCDVFDLNHGILVVGYGSKDGQDFWLVKNSWGADWGDSGYIRMARDRENMCGIASRASYPVV